MVLDLGDGGGGVEGGGGGGITLIVKTIIRYNKFIGTTAWMARKVKRCHDIVMI